MRNGITAVGLLAGVLASGMAQTPPANDEFTNRIALARSLVNWIGNTTGATMNDEPDLDFGLPNWLSEWGWSEKSVWWSWVAPMSGTVAVEVTGDFARSHGFLAVYAHNEGERGDPICHVDLGVHGQYAVFSASSGHEYTIRLNRHETNDLSLRLTVTNAPVLRLQPRTQTVSANAGALLTAWAFGVQPMKYQWRYNGVDMLGATNAMLPIQAATTTNAGEYCVVVSSGSGGVSTSVVARLIVSPDDPLPSVQALGMVAGTNFEFTMTGEEGRSYLIESSTSLMDWPVPIVRSVINHESRTSTVAIASAETRNFFRITPYHPKDNLCNLQLRQLWFASWQFAEDHHEPPEGVVTQVALIPYLINHAWPRCPLNITEDPSDYIIQWVEFPTFCAYGHYLEEPW